MKKAVYLSPALEHDSVVFAPLHRIATSWLLSSELWFDSLLFVKTTCPSHNYLAPCAGLVGLLVHVAGVRAVYDSQLK